MRAKSSRETLVSDINSVFHTYVSNYCFNDIAQLGIDKKCVSPKKRIFDTTINYKSISFIIIEYKRASVLYKKKCNY